MICLVHVPCNTVIAKAVRDMVPTQGMLLASDDFRLVRNGKQPKRGSEIWCPTCNAAVKVVDITFMDESAFTPPQRIKNGD